MIVSITGVEYENGEPESTEFPVSELRNYRKFITVLKEMKREFDVGYKQFI